MERTNSNSWVSFVKSLGATDFKRTVRVLSGEYFSGSLYNISFSNGDVFRITDRILSKVQAVLYHADEMRTIDIPLDYKGYFQVIPDHEPYTEAVDLYHCVKVDLPAELQPRFKNNISFALEDGTVIAKGERLILHGFEEKQKQIFLRCKLLKMKDTPVVLVPPHCKWELQECHDDRYYSIDNLLQWKMLVGRQRFVKVINTSFLSQDLPDLKNFSGVARLLPTYSMKALLLEGTEVIIPPDIDMEVIDISESVNKSLFFRPQTLDSIYSMADKEFPLIVEIKHIAHNKNLSKTGHKCQSHNLQVGECLTILRREEVKKCLVTDISDPEKKRHFLVPSTYQGMVSQVSRIFRYVFDLVFQGCTGQNLTVLATKDYTAEASSLSSFHVGDQFRVLMSDTVVAQFDEKTEAVGIVEFENMETNVIVKFPTYAEGGFLEILHDNKSCTLAMLISQAPCHFKVDIQDPSVEDDPLHTAKELRLHKEIYDQCLVVTKEDSSLKLFELPINRIHMTVELLSKQPSMHNQHTSLMSYASNVELIPEDCYSGEFRYEYVMSPPPLPPRTSRSQSSSEVQLPPALPRRNMLETEVPAGIPHAPLQRLYTPPTGHITAQQMDHPLQLQILADNSPSNPKKTNAKSPVSLKHK
ncbi:protein THEMIS3-like isoform X2 [Polyodon spathula]|uniref:protein THEMIS3-like isoform X2 n=1 Tax=Polyodon spathula TaxID=7913 RepID=UPI001B7E5063|nr:protein THEMIS3-like isoform X2 [Polyodon spathula]